jgi:glyoxylase-like metal-dependent hydrolase (beta-lactamase superfamily II)
MEGAPGIHRIEAPLGDRIICLFLLVGEDRTLLVDTGIDETPRTSLVPFLSNLGIAAERIDYVLITHADLDHQGGNATLRELVPNATFVCHELDRTLIESTERLIAERYGEFAADHGIDDSEETKAWYRAVTKTTRVDLGLQGGETLRLGPDWTVEILHVPGHSRGHLAVWDPRSQTAVIADAALQNAVRTKEGAPAFPPTYRYLDAYLATIQRLQGMPIEILLTSHYPVFRGAEVGDFLTESRAFADRVDAAVCEELRAAREPRTTRQLVASLAPSLGAWPEPAGALLVFPLVGHLERLQQRGRIAAERVSDVVAWRWRE